VVFRSFAVVECDTYCQFVAFILNLKERLIEAAAHSKASYTNPLTYLLTYLLSSWVTRDKVKSDRMMWYTRTGGSQRRVQLCRLHVRIHVAADHVSRSINGWVWRTASSSGWPAPDECQLAGYWDVLRAGFVAERTTLWWGCDWC